MTKKRIRARGVRIVASAKKRKRSRSNRGPGGVAGTRNPSHPDFHPSKAQQNGWKTP